MIDLAKSGSWVLDPILLVALFLCISFQNTLRGPRNLTTTVSNFSDMGKIVRKCQILYESVIES